MASDVFELLGTAEATRLMTSAIERATDTNRRLGLAEPVKIHGEWLAKYPDGHLETIVRAGTTPENRGTVQNPKPRVETITAEITIKIGDKIPARPRRHSHSA